jgi:hypothetical protein
MSECCPQGFWGGLCRFFCVLVLIALGTGMHAQWVAYCRYKKVSADEYEIWLTLQDGSQIKVESGHYIKDYRTFSRVDVIRADKGTKISYYDLKRVSVVKKP